MVLIALNTVNLFSNLLVVKFQYYQTFNIISSILLQLTYLRINIFKQNSLFNETRTRISETQQNKLKRFIICFMCAFNIKNSRLQYIQGMR